MRTMKISLFSLLFISLLACFVNAQTVIKQNNPQSRGVALLLTDTASATSAGKTGLTGAAAAIPVTVTAGAAGSFTSIKYRRLISGAALTVCAGTIEEVGAGLYLYIPTVSEANTTYDTVYIAQATGATDGVSQVAYSTYKIDDVAGALPMGGTPGTGIAPNSAGGLITVGTGAGQLNVSGTGKVPATIAAGDAADAATLLTRMGTPAGASIDADILTRSTFAAGQSVSLGASDSLTLATGTVVAVGTAPPFVTLASSALSTTDAYKGCLLRIIGGTGAGQVRYIASYSPTSFVRRAYLSTAFAITPDTTSVYVVQSAQGAGMNQNYYVTSTQAPIAVDGDGNVYVSQASNAPFVTAGSVGFPASVTNYAGLQSADIAAIFGAMAATYNGAGTMGAKLNSVGGSGSGPTAQQIATQVLNTVITPGGLTTLQANVLNNAVLAAQYTKTDAITPDGQGYYERTVIITADDGTTALSTQVTYYSDATMFRVVKRGKPVYTSALTSLMAH